jgi:hypothetical protein
MPKSISNTPTNAIQHLPLREPDWLALKILPPRPCAEAIQAILGALEGGERWIYAIRGECLRLFDERTLFREYTDPATNQPCTCTDRFLKVYLPDSWRYCEEALKNRQALFDSVPLESAVRMTRANLRLLEGASESVRKLPEVHAAGEKQTQEQFAATLSQEPYNQHLEARRTLKFTFTAGEAEIVEQALGIVGKLIGIEDLSGELLALAIDYIAENREEEAQ